MTTPNLPPHSWRELARRTSDRIEVTLAWEQQTDRLMVSALDSSSGRRLEFEPRRDQALHAFYHPYAYAACIHARRRSRRSPESAAEPGPTPSYSKSLNC